MSGLTNKLPALSVGILAGGKSSRMGKNKALLKIENERIIDRTIKEMKGFSEVLISAAAKGEYEALGLKVVYDKNRDIGPIEGIRQVLIHAENEYVFICASDMPFLKKELTAYLREFICSDYDCYVLTDEDHIQPLCAIYSKRVLPVIEELIAEGRYRLREIFNRVSTKYIPLSLSCFSSKTVKNINTREEYEALRGPIVFAVSGYSNSGKTGLIVRLINEFIKEGMTVAVLKHDGHDSFYDVDGSDTDMFFRAGAVCSAIFSDSRFGMHKRKKISPEIFISEMRKSETPPDVIILEGLKDSSYPKIETLRSGIVEKSVCDKKSLICLATAGIDIDAGDVPVYNYEDVSGIFRCVKEYFG